MTTSPSKVLVVNVLVSQIALAEGILNNCKSKKSGATTSTEKKVNDRRLSGGGEQRGVLLLGASLPASRLYANSFQKHLFSPWWQDGRVCHVTFNPAAGCRYCNWNGPIEFADLGWLFNQICRM
jgi:hypothetical protein